MILLDANVFSAPMRHQADPVVVAWLEQRTVIWAQSGESGLFLKLIDR